MHKRMIAWVMLPAALSLLYGCAGPAARGVHDIRVTIEALHETEPGRMKLMEPGTDIEKAAIERFKDFYKVFSAERINASIGEVYSGDAYFEDGIRQVRGLNEIKAYFLGTTGAFESCTFDIRDVAVSRGDYYFRWVMDLKLKRDPDNPLILPGMSHVRFDEQGKIVFHQDYWETLQLFERFPLIGTVIRWIKARI